MPPHPNSLLTLEQRFWMKVQKTDTCWLWTGSRTRLGYGRFYVGRDGIVTAPASRVAYELIVGSVPHGMLVLHHCDNPPCVRPDHLFLGTHKDNALDKTDKGRHHSQLKTHCPAGHPYNEINTRRAKNERACRVCGRAAQARYRIRHAATN